VKRLLVLAVILCGLVLEPAEASDFINFGVLAAGAPLGQINLPTNNLVALYSVVQQRGYSGPCLNIQRSSDNTPEDIRFKNGVCDVASAMTFIGSGSGYVDTFYDESGRGCPATSSPSSTTSPLFSSVDQIGGIPGITINPSSLSQILNLCSGLSLDTQNQTIITVYAPSSSGGDNTGSPVWLLGSPYTQGGNSLFINGTGDELFHNGTQTNTNLFSYSMIPSVSVVTSSSAAKTYQLNNQLITGIASTPENTTTGGLIGSIQAGGGYPFFGQLYMLAIYNTVLSQTEISTIVSSLMSEFSVPTTREYSLGWDGDSISFGAYTTLFQNYLVQALPLLNAPVYPRNIALSGEYLSAMYGKISTDVLPFYNASLAANIWGIAGGTNDICLGGSTGSALFTNYLEPYVSALKTRGFEVVVGTLIYNAACSLAQNTQREAYNSLVKSNASSLGYVVADFDSIPQLQFPQASGYSADGTHPTTLGDSLMSPIAASAINAYIPI
jgi:hypothetical protein